MVFAARRREVSLPLGPLRFGEGPRRTQPDADGGERDDPEKLALVLPDADAPVAQTHWSFDQLASLVGAPAAYLRQLPAPLAGINLQYGLTNHRAKSAAFALINSLPSDRSSECLFPAVRGNGAYAGLRKIWIQICERVEIEGAVMHTLRHSYASVAAELNYSDATIAAMLGHSLSTVTSRYTHFVDEVLRASADRVSKEIDARMRMESAST